MAQDAPHWSLLGGDEGDTPTARPNRPRARSRLGRSFSGSIPSPVAADAQQEAPHWSQLGGDTAGVDEGNSHMPNPIRPRARSRLGSSLRASSPLGRSISGSNPSPVATPPPQPAADAQQDAPHWSQLGGWSADDDARYTPPHAVCADQVRVNVQVEKEQGTCLCLVAMEKAAPMMLVCAAIWAVFTVFMMLNILIGETIDYTTSLDDNQDALLWYIMGSMAMVIVATMSSFYVVNHACSCSRWAALSDDLTDPTGYFTTYLIIAWLTLMIIYGTFDPTGHLRPLQTLRDHATGERSLVMGCMRDAAYTHITLPPNESYFVLADPEWTVDWGSKLSKSEYGWTYLLVPLVYRGPVDGCSFDRKIYAACIAKTATMEGCWLADKQRGPYTALRRSRAVQYWGPGEHARLRGLVSGIDMDTQVVEFNSQSLEEAKMEIAYRENQRHETMLSLAVLWLVVAFVGYACSAVYVACYILEELERQQGWARNQAKADSEDSALHESLLH